MKAPAVPFPRIELEGVGSGGAVEWERASYAGITIRARPRELRGELLARLVDKVFHETGEELEL